MKRVYCLYRVSTLGQVEKDDIPMQRQACHAFAEKQGWQIIAEFSEKGVSGFKQSAEQREALVAIKQAAILKKFDVLLVFMFDRLGRRDDETPFVVEWFVKNGIAVWSVMEGEQRFENHVDKLLNYIRFWQSSGESIKTALRTRVRMEQLIQENGYVGGTAPYGYRLCKLGRVNKRGFEVHDLLMDPAKAEVIKTIFRLYCEEDMGPYRIAVHLTQQGELTRRGTQWNAASVRNILGNAIYTGIRTYGAIQTERFSHLQIVSDELYLCAQQKLQACRLEEPRPLRSQHWDAVLLKDRPYCMHCGKPVTVSRNRKSRRKRDGTVAVYDRMKYICINKNAFEPCTGQRNYSTRRIDQLILEAVGRMLFSDAFKIPSMDENSALSRCWQLAQELVYDKPANLKVTVTKTGNKQLLAGDSMRYDLTVANNSNVALENFYLHDQFPTDCSTAKTITTGTYNTRLNYQITYKTNYNDYRVLATNLLSTNNYAFDLSAVQLMQGEVVTDVRLEFGKVPAGFASVVKPTVTVQTSASLANGYQVVNRVDAGGQYMSQWETGRAAWITLIVRLNEPTLPKTGY